MIDGILRITYGPKALPVCPFCDVSVTEHSKGECLDAWVASLMCWTSVEKKHEYIRMVGYYDWFGKPPRQWVPPDGTEKELWWWAEDDSTLVPNYSEDKCIMWQMVEWMQDLGDSVDITAYRDPTISSLPTLSRRRVDVGILSTQREHVRVGGDDIAHALCVAVILSLSDWPGEEEE